MIFISLKKSKIKFKSKTKIITDTGYLGIQKLHQNSIVPKKEDRDSNRKISREIMVIEKAIEAIKRFKIVSDVYRNRRKRFGLRFNLIAGIYNFELGG